MNTEQLPDIIEITITEEDRQKAEPFGSNCNCLMATALKRIGFSKVCVDTFGAAIEREEYKWDRHAGCDELQDLTIGADITEAPFYGKGVVGKKFTATKCK